MPLLAATFVLSMGAVAVQATEFQFATPAEGAAILTADDDYLMALSPADPALRLRSEKSETVAKLKTAYASHVLTWSAAERARVEAVLDRDRKQLSMVSRWLPERVDFILVSKDVEGGLPHTRASAIVLPEAWIESTQNLDGVVMHELFHVLSRNNLARRDSLYALIGFRPCHVIEPAAYAARRITNPDAPSLAHYLPLTDDGKEGLVPYLYAAATVFDPRAGADFEQQFHVGFLHVQVTDGASTAQCAPFPGKADPMLPLSAHRDLIERETGGNTGYLIHPEETLADNFMLLMVGGSKPIASPWVLEKLRAWLEIPAGALPAGGAP